VKTSNVGAKMGKYYVKTANNGAKMGKCFVKTLGLFQLIEV
jgi:hypothetical protein